MEPIGKFLTLGMVIPEPSDREFFYYRSEGRFFNRRLEARRRLIPDLFQIGKNVILDPVFSHKNLDHLLNFWDQFPEVHFEDHQSFLNFAATPTFYLVQDRNQVMGDDLLGNEYDRVNLLFAKVIPGDPLGHYDLYSQEELTSCFLTHLDFIDPISGERFSDRAVKRLQRILLDLFRISIEAEALLNTIDSIQSGLRGRLAQIEELKGSPEVRDFFEHLLKIGLCMRRGGLKSEETLGDVDHLELSHLLLNYPNDSVFGSLPLFCYKTGSWIMSVNQETGHDIHDRIKIVIDNAQTQACIRLTSNWLCATSWYYSNRYLQEQLFRLEDLDWIN